MNDRAAVLAAATSIEPASIREAWDQAWTCRWIASGAPLYRTTAPDVPNPHVVAVFAPMVGRRVLLVDHVKAGCWTLGGGHVEPGERLSATVRREAREELGADVLFTSPLGERPAFLTLIRTRLNPHIDVAFWYVVTLDPDAELTIDRGELRDARWFDLDDPGDWARGPIDPNVTRFRRKLRQIHSARVGRSTTRAVPASN